MKWIKRKYIKIDKRPYHYDDYMPQKLFFFKRNGMPSAALRLKIRRHQKEL